MIFLGIQVFYTYHKQHCRFFSFISFYNLLKKFNIVLSLFLNQLGQNKLACSNKSFTFKHEINSLFEKISVYLWRNWRKYSFSESSTIGVTLSATVSRLVTRLRLVFLFLSTKQWLRPYWSCCNSRFLRMVFHRFATGTLHEDVGSFGNIRLSFSFLVWNNSVRKWRWLIRILFITNFV